MSEKTNNIPTYQQFKKIVKYEFENKYKDKGFKLSNVYQIKSREFGFANWNTLSAILKKKNNSKTQRHSPSVQHNLQQGELNIQ